MTWFPDYKKGWMLGTMCENMMVEQSCGQADDYDGQWQDGLVNIFVSDWQFFIHS
jgi:hypothetical protein